MIDTSRLHKLLDESRAGSLPHVHRDTWRRTTLSNGAVCLEIAPSGGHVDLLLTLAQHAAPPFFVLFVLQVARATGHAARYQSRPLTHAEASEFMAQHRDFFERDARHGIWLAAPESYLQLVYDEHDLIYAYGDIESFIDVLTAAGFTEGEFSIPDPHGHSFHPEFDAAEIELVELEDFWRVTPLAPSDER